MATPIHTVNPKAANNWLEAGQALLVDVREVSEYQAERIAGALLMPLSEFDPETFPRLSGARIVLLCAIGKRSMAAAGMLQKLGHTNLWNMEGGLKAWKTAGLETEVPEPVSNDPELLASNG